MYSYDVLKEPRGFVKFIQILLAICAFATTCDFSATVNMSVKCYGRQNDTIRPNYTFSYPFRINENLLPICPKSTNQTSTSEEPHYSGKNSYGDFSTSSQFFVFTGVLVFLYCIVAVILYIVYSDEYVNNDRPSKADFILSILLTVLWFIASSAWADGVQQFKGYTAPERIFNEMKDWEKHDLHVSVRPTYGGLNASLIFGFTNILLWAASLWFIWKETSWARQNDSLIDPGSVSAADGSPM
ncbi:unnamed protein product [Calicophoron daubneyi]|uniref:MARVEL domain-containing protein n=1 Tax=Calicophoron daubneyi TaxID=300641 RepID=A0AAV2T4B1_CALDB